VTSSVGLINHYQQLVNSLLTLPDGLESEVFWPWGIQIKEKPLSILLKLSG